MYLSSEYVLRCGSASQSKLVDGELLHAKIVHGVFTAAICALQNTLAYMQISRCR